MRSRSRSGRSGIDGEDVLDIQRDALRPRGWCLDLFGLVLEPPFVFGRGAVSSYPLCIAYRVRQARPASLDLWVCCWASLISYTCIPTNRPRSTGRRVMCSFRAAGKRETFDCKDLPYTRTHKPQALIVHAESPRTWRGSIP